MSTRRIPKGPGRRPKSLARRRFMELLNKGVSIRAACREIGVCRQTGQNWKNGVTPVMSAPQSRQLRNRVALNMGRQSLETRFRTSESARSRVWSDPQMWHRFSGSPQSSKLVTDNFATSRIAFTSVSEHNVQADIPYWQPPEDPMSGKRLPPLSSHKPLKTHLTRGIASPSYQLKVVKLYSTNLEEHWG